MRAREEYAKKGYDIDYFDVTRDDDAREEMIDLSGGTIVPVVVEEGKITIGFGGT